MCAWTLVHPYREKNNLLSLSEKKFYSLVEITKKKKKSLWSPRNLWSLRSPLSGYTTLRPMRRIIAIFWGSIVATGVATYATSTFAQNEDRTSLFIFEIEHEHPSDISSAKEDVISIESDIAQAQCGGWDWGQSVVGAIPQVSGLPGRYGAPLNQVRLGMAERNETMGFLEDGFFFPNKAQSQGWTSICRPGNPPYYQDGAAIPPCNNPQDCAQLCENLNRWQFPVNYCERRVPGTNPPVFTYRYESV